jgi:malate dehydrogenase (oxaloacetate-decarboxylating)
LQDLNDLHYFALYALLARSIEEMRSIVYTPTVGLGCQQFSRIFRKVRGLFQSIPRKDRIRRILGHRGRRLTFPLCAPLG